jgi:PAS domain S-box-containing protein
MGYTVTGIAITGKEALKMAVETQPDVILMDIRLKGDMDGIETTARIHEITDIPVIYLTAYTDAETLQRALKTDMSSYLVKPYNPRELYSNIEFAIYKHRLKEKIGSSREKLELFLSRSAECGIIIDLRKKVVYANAAAEAYTGYSIEELMGKDIFFILTISPARREETSDETLHRLLSMDAIHYIPFQALISMKGGRVRPVVIRAGIVRKTTGRFAILFSDEGIKNTIARLVPIFFKYPFVFGKIQKPEIDDGSLMPRNWSWLFMASPVITRRVCRDMKSIFSFWDFHHPASAIPCFQTPCQGLPLSRDIFGIFSRYFCIPPKDQRWKGLHP